MIKAQEVERSIILFIHNGYKIKLAKTHGRPLTILILLSFFSFILILLQFFNYLFIFYFLYILILLAASLFKERD